MPAGSRETCQTLTPAELDSFLQSLKAAGLGESALKRYQSDLVQLQRYLGPQGRIGPATLAAWQTDMRALGYAPRSITARILTANRYLHFCHRPDLCQQAPHGEVKSEKITWPEYTCLLDTARMQGRWREELLIRTFAEAGLRVNELELLTVEAVAAGVLKHPPEQGGGRVRLPQELRRDLLQYTRQNGIAAGPVFASRAGNPASRAIILTSLQRVARDAGIPVEKAAPRCLQRLYETNRARPAVAEPRATAAAIRRGTASAVTLDTGQQAQAAADA